MSDGETMERLWSYLRRFARMTKEMRPAHRIDVLSSALIYYGIQTKGKLGELFAQNKIDCSHVAMQLLYFLLGLNVQLKPKKLLKKASIKQYLVPMKAIKVIAIKFNSLILFCRKGEKGKAVALRRNGKIFWSIQSTS